MRSSPVYRTAAVLTAAALLGACYNTQLPPISAAGAGFEPLKDELALWQESRAEEKTLLEEARLYDDPLLVDYLEEVAGRLTTPGMAANRQIRYRVTVMEDPTLNAFAYPHGSLFVHTGLLARLENEDQLATVLGHEMTHVENRHMLRFRRSARNKQIGLTVASVAAAVLVAGEAGDAWAEGDYGKAARISVLADVIVGLGLQLAFLAAVYGYGRGLELEADYGALAKLEAAGYDPRAAPAVYQALLDDHGEPSKAEAFFFGSHPQLTRRIENAEEWLSHRPELATAAVAGETAVAMPPPDREFALRMRRVVRDDARLNLELGRLNLAEAELQRVLALLPEDPETHYLLARLYLARAEAEQDPAAAGELTTLAEGALREALRLDPEHAEARREVGLLAYRAGNRATACTEFRLYLETAPEGEDTEAIRDYLLELEREGACWDGTETGG